MQCMRILFQQLVIIIGICLFILISQSTQAVAQQLLTKPDATHLENQSTLKLKPDFSCSTDSIRNQFDFWVGKWDVFVRGKKAAESHIERTLDGCMILENYRNLNSGYTGKSMNFYDAKQKQWIQIWADSEGNASRYSGKLKDDNMYFSGINNRRDGSQTDVRMEFIPKPDGTVRQIYEQSTDGGTTWETLFDGIYRPRQK